MIYLETIFNTLGNQTRLKIIKYLFKNGESICVDISNGLNFAQPTMCHHYQKLKNSGVINIRKEKTTNFYSINPDFEKNSGIDLQKIIHHIS